MSADQINMEVPQVVEESTPPTETEATVTATEETFEEDITTEATATATASDQKDDDVTESAVEPESTEESSKETVTATEDSRIVQEESTEVPVEESSTEPPTTQQVANELPVVREDNREDHDLSVPAEVELDSPDASPTAAEEEESKESSEVNNVEELQKKADEDFDDLFMDDDEEHAEEDGPIDAKASGSDEKPSKSTTDSALKDMYDPKLARAATERAQRHAMDADGAKTTTLVEATTALVDEGQDINMDDLDWLNEEDDNYTFEDLFPEGMDEELALEDGTAPALAIADVAAPDEEKEQIKTNAFEEGLERLKRKRVQEEMTPQQAEDKMEDLICKMTTAADEDCEIIRKNMAKDRLQTMCQKATIATKKNQPFLGKKENNQRMQKLYKVAQFPGGKEKLRSYFDKDEKFVPSKALAGTKKLLQEHGAEPALSKVSILKFCINEIQKPTNQSWFVMFGGLSVIRTWLMPSPDGTLPALSIRTEMLRLLAKLPITQSNLRKSKLGLTIKELTKREDETLNNRKLCMDLINRWLSLVLDTETSIKRHRATQQHNLADSAQPVSKKRKTKAEIAAADKEIQERRHPQMFQKPSHNFVVQPSFDVKSMGRDLALARQTRKGKVSKISGELRALKPALRHEHVKISANGIHLDF